MTSAAGILFQTKDGRLLLMRRAKDGTWGLPGGQVEPGERLQQAARRETQEETGMEYDGPLKRYARRAGRAASYTTFLAHIEQPFKVHLNDEHIEARWAPLREALELPLHPGLRSVLEPPQAQDASPKRKAHPLAQPEQVLRPIHTNLGTQAAYRKKLQALILAMYKDVKRTIKRAYKPAAETVGMAQDAADPAVVLRRLLRRLGVRWTLRFERASEEIARMFANRSQRDLERAFMRRLREAGFTVRFTPTDRVVSAYRAIVAENVGLIRSIPQQFLSEVQTIVWQNVMRGSDLHTLGTEIRKRYGKSFDRAALIARDQSNKARSVFEETRRAELGVEEAIWMHSHAGAHPRPTHVAMHGKRYNIRVGMWDPDPKVQAYIWPGTEINCRCSSRSILPGMTPTGAPPEPPRTAPGAKVGKVNVTKAILQSAVVPKSHGRKSQ